MVWDPPTPTAGRRRSGAGHPGPSSVSESQPWAKTASGAPGGTTGPRARGSRAIGQNGQRGLRLKRRHGLLAPRRLAPPSGDAAHAGRITADRPDVIGSAIERLDTRTTARARAEGGRVATR